MRLQSRRRNLLSNRSTPAGESRAPRPVRSWRLRWWLRTGALLSVIGIRRLARARWQRVFLVTGALVFVIGLMLRSSVAFVSGMLIMGSAVSRWRLGGQCGGEGRVASGKGEDAGRPARRAGPGRLAGGGRGGLADGSDVGGGGGLEELLASGEVALQSEGHKSEPQSNR